MFNLDPSTPQLKVVKDLMDGITSFNLDEVVTLLSKKFQYEVLNGVTDLAKLDKERYAAMVQGLLDGIAKVDVSIQQRRTILNPTN